MTNLDSILKSRDITLSTKVRLVKATVFLMVMYGCESWTIKKAEHRRIDAFELWCWRRLLRVPWDSKEIQPVHPKGNQSWIFIWRTDAEAETPILWPPDAKKWFTGKDPDAGKDWRQEEKRMTEDEMVGWHHQLNGHEFEHLGDGEGQGSLHAAVHGVAKSQTWLSNWTTIPTNLYSILYLHQTMGTNFFPQCIFIEKLLPITHTIPKSLNSLLLQSMHLIKSITMELHVPQGST